MADEDDFSVIDSLLVLCNIIDIVFVQPAIFLTSESQLKLIPYYMV